MSDGSAPNLVHRRFNVAQPTGHVKDVHVFSAGRKCKTWGCKTMLSIYNGDIYCCVCGDKRLYGKIK